MPDCSRINSRLRLRGPVDPDLEAVIRSYRDAPPPQPQTDARPATKRERRRKRAELRREAAAARAAKAGGPDPLAELVGVVKARIREAGETLRRIKTPREFNQLRNFATIWPDFVREKQTDYPDAATQLPRLTASPQQISRLDEVLGWLMVLDDDQRKIVGCYMGKVPRTKIARMFGCSRHTVMRRYDAAVREIASRLLVGDRAA